VRCGLTFVQSSIYVNMSRIKPQKLKVEAGRVKLTNGYSHAHVVGIMLGVVTECALISEAAVGPAMSPYVVHKISIVPFTQEMRRDTSVWGQLYNFDVISGPITEMGISFSTRKKAETPISSPRKSGLFKSFAASSIAPMASSSSSPSTSYPASKSFLEPSTFCAYCAASPLTFSIPVPIYDGREVGSHKAFTFTDDDFNKLHTWRLYKDGRRDLDDRSVVAVGYTIGTYLSGKTQERSLSANVQFVVLLGKTAAN
jgi:hypothetical protein